MKIIKQLSDADHALGQLAGVGRMLPNPHLLIRPFIRREAVLSSRIEGTVTRLDQLFMFEAEPNEISYPSDVSEVANYVRALEHGVDRIRNGMPLTLRLLCEVHRVLLEGVRGGERRPGEFRQCGVMIGRQGQSFEQARFVPPCHTVLDPLLTEFEKFINEERSLPPIVQLALAHYQFEAIHPFMDGNGRMGRLLITLMLCERNYLPQPLLYVSAYLEKNDEEYKDCLLKVSQKGAWNDWIRFFAAGVAEQARDAPKRAEQLLDLWRTYRQQAAEVSNSATALQLVDELFASPFLTITRTAELLGVSFPTAQSNMKKL